MSKRIAVLLLPFLVLAAIATGGVTAQTGGRYDMSWNAVTSGGTAAATGGVFRIGAAIGQPGAGALSATGYTLVGGFWGGGGAQYRMSLPLAFKM